MDAYDPNQTPDPAAWLQLEEDEQLLLVKTHHQEHAEPMPSVDAHAAMHTVVESQLALGQPAATTKALQRHMAKGCDRHTALHLVMEVVANVMFAAMNGEIDPLKVNEELERRIAAS